MALRGINSSLSVVAVVANVVMAISLKSKQYMIKLACQTNKTNNIQEASL